LNRSPIFRALLASAALAAAVALSGCDTDGTTVSGRAMKPISDKTLAEIAQKNMTKDSPILVRIFKEEAELEVWKQDRNGQFALLKSFPICRWSGDLGPKIKEGDRQAPEGFYTITPAQMNPTSQYYLAFNMGFPNSYDQANGRTGNFLMIHGDCSSRGCYAMTDEQISEIYALARESFFGGQRAFQVQAYPFHMTPTNMAKHRNNPNMPFWKMLKEGSDHFEVTRREPKVDVCDRRYVFDAAPPANSSAPLNFSPRAQCPVYQLPADIVAAVTDKKRRDEIETAELINRGAPVAPVKLATDGGMHPVFVAALRGGREVKDSQGEVRSIFSVTAPGTIPPNVSPPEPKAMALADSEAANTAPQASAPRQPARPASLIRTANAETAPPAGKSAGSIFASNKTESESKSPSILSRVSSIMGLRGSTPAAAEEAAPAAPAAAPVAKPATTAAAAAIRPKAQAVAEPSETPTRTANAGAIRPQAKPAELNTASADATAKPASGTSLLSGAAPVVPTGSFGNSWSALR
jgi:murein L,D-transpeptidase YafK